MLAFKNIPSYAGMLWLVDRGRSALYGSHDSFKSGFDANATALFGAQPGAYDATVKAGTDAGATTPISGGTLNLVFSHTAMAGVL